jgi:hypothetical protein
MYLCEAQTCLMSRQHYPMQYIWKYTSPQRLTVLYSNDYLLDSSWLRLNACNRLDTTKAGGLEFRVTIP